MPITSVIQSSQPSGIENAAILILFFHVLERQLQQLERHKPRVPLLRPASTRLLIQIKGRAQECPIPLRS
jgi:hypothetical protein